MHQKCAAWQSSVLVQLEQSPQMHCLKSKPSERPASLRERKLRAGHGEQNIQENSRLANYRRVYNPTQQPRIPSLQNLIDGKVDLPTAIPQNLPCETQRSTEVSSHQFRFSDSGVYENLHSNLPPSAMSFTQEPLPDTLSQQTLGRYGSNAPFRHRSIIQKWVDDIFGRTGSHKLIEFNTTVELAEKRDTKWILTLRKERSDTQQDQW